MAPITSTQLTIGNQQSAQTAYTTASISPTADRLVLCFITGVDNGANEEVIVNTVTGAGMTWVKEAEVTHETTASPVVVTSVFRALESSPGSGALTITFDRQCQIAGWHIHEFAEVDTGGSSGADAVVQSAVNDNDSITTIAATLSAFAGTNNATVGMFKSGGGSGRTWTPSTGFAEISESGGAGYQIAVHFRDDNATNVESTCTNAGPHAAIGLELRNAITAITQSLLLAEIDTVDRTVYTTSSISPSANKLVLCLVSATDNFVDETILVNSVTGANLTWVEVAEITLDTIAAPRQTLAVYRAMGTAPNSGALTITLDRQAALGQWIIAEFEFVDISGDNGENAVVQAVTNRADSGTSITATLAAFGDAANGTVGCFTSSGNPPNWTPGTGFIEIAEATGSDRVSMMEFRADNDTSVDATASVDADIAVIGLELKQAEAPPPHPTSTNVLTSGFDETDSTTYTTASISPAADKVILLGFVSRRFPSTPAPVPTAVGCGITWVEVATVEGPGDGGSFRVTVFRGIDPSPTTGTIVFTLSNSQVRGSWGVIELDGVDTGGADGAFSIVQTATNSATSVTSITATLGAFSDPGNATIGFGSADNPSIGGPYTAGSGFTFIVDEGVGSSDFNGMKVLFKNSNDTTVDFSGAGSSEPYMIIGIELKIPATSPITANLLLADGDDSDLTVYTTASISPSANKLVLCCVMCADDGFTSAVLTSTVTGAGLTWVQVNQIGFDTTVSERRGFAIFRALGPSPSSGALTITLDGPGTACRWTIVQFTNCDTGGANGSAAIVQEANNRSDTGQAISATLSSFADKNATYAYCGSGSVSTTLTEGAGYIKIGEVDLGTIKAMGQFQQGPDLIPDFTQSVDGDMAIIAVELKFVAPEGGGAHGRLGFVF